MVVKLSIPKFDSLDILQTVVNDRVQHRDFFNAIHNDWNACVLNYRHNDGNPCMIKPLDLSTYISQERVNKEEVQKVNPKERRTPLERLKDHRKSSLIGLYKPNAEKDLHTTLETMRDKHSLRFCPCCGEYGKPSTLDHYLPKSIYPEFSIVIENLTPMCTKCQGLKGNDVLDMHGNKVYLHPYFDPIELVPIELDIRPPYTNPSGFIACIPNTVPKELRSLVQRHIKEINFINRFEEYCSSEYSDLLCTIAQEKSDPEREKVSSSISRFLRHAEKKAPNFWEAIFYRGILANPHLLYFLETSDLAEFV